MGWVLGLGNGVVFRQGGGSGLGSSYWVNRHPELKTYITGLITPLSNKQIIRIGEFIEALKNGLSITNLSDAFDVMYILAGETEESSLKNLVKDAHHCTAVNAPTFTQYEGYVGGATKSLNTNYNPFAQGENYRLNSASLGVYVRTTTIGDYKILGVADAGNESWIIPRMDYDTVGRFYCRVNQATYTYKAATGDTKGMLIASRVGANAVDGYINGTDLNCYNNTELSTSLPNYNIHLLAMNLGTKTSRHSPDQLSIAFMGKGFSGAEITAITNACEAYMDALGKGVV